MTSQARNKVVWALIWILTLGGSYIAYQNADREFSHYLATFSTSPRHVSELLPSTISAFCHDPEFQANWKKFRSSGLYTALRNTSFIREPAERLGLSDHDLSPFENWVLELWGNSATLAVSQKKDAFYLISPIGNGEQSFDWLKKAINLLNKQNVPNSLHRIDNRWCVRGESSSFWPRNVHVEFFPVQGMAVLALGSLDDPITGVFDAADEPQQSLFRNPDFPRYFEESLAQASAKHQFSLFGFIRDTRQTTSFDLGNTWVATSKEPGLVDLEFSMRDSSQNKEGSPSIDANLKGLSLPDHLITMLSTTEEIGRLWNEASGVIPESVKENAAAINLEPLLGEYYGLWKPVLDKLGKDFYVGFGDAEVMSDKFRVPFPRTTIVMPFEDKKLLFNALEATVLKSNEGLQSNLAVRKHLGTYGEYYEVKMNDSDWRSEHGLKTLPFFACTNSYLVVSTHQGSIESVLGSLKDKPEATLQTQDSNAQGDKKLLPQDVTSLQLSVDMQNAPDIIRVLFGVVGLVNPQGDNVFLSPKAMSVFSEVFSVMQQFKEATVSVNYASRRRVVKVHLSQQVPSPAEAKP